MTNIYYAHACRCVSRVGQNNIYIQCITVFVAGKLPNIWSYTVYIYRSVHRLYECMRMVMCAYRRLDIMFVCVCVCTCKPNMCVCVCVCVCVSSKLLTAYCGALPGINERIMPPPKARLHSFKSL